MAQYQNICFTSYDEDFDIKFDEDNMYYMIYQFEKCPTTQKVHIQGYIELGKRMRLTGIKKLIGPKAHIEPRRGTAKQASDYCMKSETKLLGPYIFGVMKETHQGKRTDLEAVKQSITEKKRLREIVIEHTSEYIKYHNGIEKTLKIINYIARDPETKPHVTWIYGPSGSGKSRQAWGMSKDIYVKDSVNKWWDGYEQQELVLIDEYKGNWDYAYLLKVLDRYPMLVEYKGGSIQLNSPKFVITSINRPEGIELLRRIDNIINLEPQDLFNDF